MPKIIDFLSSIKLFMGLIALILAAFLLGGIFPQGLSPQEYQAQFGQGGAAWLLKSGVDNVFSSPWFLALMAAAAANLLACTVRRWRPLRLRPGVLISHLAVILLFAGGALRGVTRVSGYLALGTGETRKEFMTDSGKAEALPFEVKLNYFRITYWDAEKHFLHAIRNGTELAESAEVRAGRNAGLKAVPGDVKVLAFYPDFRIGAAGPVSYSEAPTNPALAIVYNDDKTRRPQYLFALHPDYNAPGDKYGLKLVYEYIPPRIKQFESGITVYENGALKMEKTISVNSPAHYRGYRFFQQGYDAASPGFTVIQVSKDPSVGVVYAGFALLMAGLTLAFWKEIKP